MVERSKRRGRWLLLLALLVTVGFHLLGRSYAGFALGLGTIYEPTPRHALFLLYYTLFGGAVAVLLAAGLVHLRAGTERWDGWDERPFLLCATALALLVPAALRVLVLGGAPISDDESLYRFGAELLLRGRVTAPSHELELFFDHLFLANDGRMYSQYFLGWPAILAPGVLLGVGGFVNAGVSAATVPALYLLVRDATGRVWAQVATIVFLTSPMLQLLAATELSHTSALAALTWTAYLALRTTRGSAPAWMHALVALSFSAAFFIRPLTAIGIGAPFLAVWAAGWWRSGRKPSSLLAFAAPALLMAGLFLLVNALQTGSPLKPAYLAVREYGVANAFRFAGPLNPDTTSELPNLDFGGLSSAVRIVSLGLLRLGYPLFGWPSAFVLLPLALGARGTGPFWAASALFLVLHSPLHDAGIDAVGPVHFTELALPVLVLSAVGLARGARWLEERGAAGRRVALAAVTSLVLCGLALYTPYRLKAASVIGTLANVPRIALEAAGIHDAVVFVVPPYTVGCNPAIPVPSRPFVFAWPVNEPDFGDDIVYANHLSVEADRELMDHFPGRSGWIQRWRQDCRIELTPLEEADPEEIPNAIMVQSSHGTVRFDERHPLTGEVPPGFEP